MSDDWEDIFEEEAIEERQAAQTEAPPKKWYTLCGMADLYRVVAHVECESLEIALKTCYHLFDAHLPDFVFEGKLHDKV